MIIVVKIKKEIGHNGPRMYGALQSNLKKIPINKSNKTKNCVLKGNNWLKVIITATFVANKNELYIFPNNGAKIESCGMHFRLFKETSECIQN